MPVSFDLVQAGCSSNNNSSLEKPCALKQMKIHKGLSLVTNLLPRCKTQEQ
jgi:hypothetical protein